MEPVGYLETGVLYCGDNVQRLSQFPAECVDLVYLDPPFFSGRHYEVIWGDEAEVRSFQDRREGGIHHYLDWMESRLRHLHRVLKPTGNLYLHCDQSASHYLKQLLDDIFGASNMKNEIIWQRTGGKGDALRKLPAIHDTILAYGKTPDSYFEPVRKPPDEQYKKRFSYDDFDGRGAYRLAPLDSLTCSPLPR